MDKYFHIGKEVLCMSTDLYSILGKQNILKFLDHLHTNIYITDVETDKIVYMNETMKTTFNINEPEGKICWQVLQSGMKSRCGFCKIDELLELDENHCCIWRLILQLNAFTKTMTVLLNTTGKYIIYKTLQMLQNT